VLEQTTNHQTVSRVTLAALEPTIVSAHLQMAEGGQEDWIFVELRLAMQVLVADSPSFRRLLRETVEGTGLCHHACLHYSDLIYAKEQ
jgi:hypothetical protein